MKHPVQADYLFCLQVTLVCFCLASSVFAQAQEEALPELCGKKVTVDGFVRGDQPLAEMSAIQNWLETVSEKNPDQAIWHRAEGKKMQCEAVGTQGSVRCTVAARPCAIPPEDMEPAG